MNSNSFIGRYSNRLFEILNDKYNSRVLLIEDEPIIAWQIANKLNHWGFKGVIVKESMEESREILQTAQCDVVLSNLRFIDGWLDFDFLGLLQKRKTRLIILTGLGDEALHGVDWKSNRPSFLFKPFTSHQLKQVLKVS